MSKISAIIITKNQENIIADCLDSISFCDEIIVVDGGSEDRTVEVAKRMGAKVYPLEPNDFSKLRKIICFEWVNFSSHSFGNLNCPIFRSSVNNNYFIAKRYRIQTIRDNILLIFCNNNSRNLTHTLKLPLPDLPK